MTDEAKVISARLFTQQELDTFDELLRYLNKHMPPGIIANPSEAIKYAIFQAVEGIHKEAANDAAN